jgi:15-cis-phytoene synthase
VRTPGLDLSLDGAALIRRSSFGPGALFLDARAREDLGLYYAFCRAVDDCADEYAPAQARRHLTRWRRELDALHRGKPQTPLGLALAGLCVRRGLPAGLLDDLWAGAWSDARPKVRYHSYSGLRRYCYQVAGSVGVACLPIFGLDLKRATPYALALGEAFQLINILRDVAEDAQRGRLYIAAEDLELHGLSEKGFLTGRGGARSERLLYDYAWRARACLRRADEAAQGLPAAGLRPSRLMRALYGRLLEQMADDGLRVLEFRYSLSPATKALIVGRALLRLGA